MLGVGNFQEGYHISVLEKGLSAITSPILRS